jgi:SAM-dependent methyltransferase
MDRHWTERMFIDAAHLFGADLEERVERAREQAAGLIDIFSEFQVPRGSTILDLASGIGRHSVALAEMGYKVVGVDISPAYIERAKEMAEERGVGESCDFRIGDMRWVGEELDDCRGKFGATISMYTSMGYYDEETDESILRQLLSLAATNGVLIIDGAPRDRFIRQMRPIYVDEIGEDLVLIEESKWNLESSRIENVWRYYRKDGKDLRHLDTIETDHRVYSLHELRRMVEDGGWTYRVCYGGFDREPFTMDSRRMILIAQKDNTEKLGL